MSGLVSDHGMFGDAVRLFNSLRNDVESCEDRVVHVKALIALIRLAPPSAQGRHMRERERAMLQGKALCACCTIIYNLGQLHVQLFTNVQNVICTIIYIYIYILQAFDLPSALSTLPVSTAAHNLLNPPTWSCRVACDTGLRSDTARAFHSHS